MCFPPSVPHALHRALEVAGSRSLCSRWGMGPLERADDSEFALMDSTACADVQCSSWSGATERILVLRDPQPSLTLTAVNLATGKQPVRLSPRKGWSALRAVSPVADSMSARNGGSAHDSKASRFGRGRGHALRCVLGL